MIKLLLFFCFIVLLMGQKSFAFDEWCDPCCNHYGFSAYADYLYWKVESPDDTDITVNLVPSINFAVQPSYSSGYRVGGNFYYNCIDLGARYTSLYNLSSIRDPLPTTTNQIFGIDYQLQFQVVDIELGYIYCIQCPCAYLKPYLGAKFAWLDDRATDYRVNNTPMFDTTKTRAFGPLLGIEGSWEIFRCWLPLSLIARGDISILDGSSRIERTNGIVRTKYFNFLTVIDIYLGLGIDFHLFSCLDANIQVGYEAQQWNGFFGSFSFNTGTLSLGGLVARFGVMY